MNEKRMFTALALSFAVLFLFNFFFKSEKTQTADNQLQTLSQSQETSESMFTKQESIRETKKAASPAEDISTEEDIIVETDIYKIVFSDIGASIKELWVKDDQGENGLLLLLKEERPNKRVFALECSHIAGLEGKRYSVKKRSGQIEFLLAIPEEIRILKTIDYSNSERHLEVAVEITNLSQNAEQFSYRLAGPSGMEEIGAVKGRQFVGAGLMIDGSVMRKNSVKGSLQQEGEISWIGLANRYFASILKPYDSKVSAILTGNKQEGLSTAIETKQRSITSGGSVSDSYLLYAGPVRNDILASYGAYFEEIVNYGWFGAISKMLLKALRFFHSVTGNWGVAILLLTFCVNLLSLPLTKKSFVSMHRMKSIQPHMQKLKELHKDNPQKMNKEMMELYKKYNINPFGGCLPMLLQIPIFIALYQGLMKAVELRGAGFLWIKDLAGPEAIPLPFSLPLIGSTINILPLVMAGMMIVQQKLNDPGAGMTDEQASQQKMMMLMMPVFFGFILYNMPSGLVLYWLTNTMLMTSEHFLLKKQLG